MPVRWTKASHGPVWRNYGWRLALTLTLWGGLATLNRTHAAEPPLPIIDQVELQPLLAEARRIATALDAAGAPLSADQQQALDKAISEADPKKGARAVQDIFDPLCIAMANINPESRVKVRPGPAPRQLTQQGWNVFLVKVFNEAGVTAPLNCTSPNAASVYRMSTNSPSPPPLIKPGDVLQRWMEVAIYNRQPLLAPLSGLKLEYRLLEIYSRDAGQREGKLVFDVGQGTQDLGFRNEIDLLFDCRPAVGVQLRVLDDDGQPTTGQFVIRDTQGRVYPARSRRLAPDFFFQDQIYRADGETVMLPAGKYDVTYTRGPEYQIDKRTITVPAEKTHRESFQFHRWINLSKLGWFSGDHHIHAAGCAHYDSPTEGVQPSDMMRHVVGEDLNVGCVLTWGPCWYHQKKFFEGKPNALSTPRNSLRYDVEVSGFPSSPCGHLSLIRLAQDDYPGTTKIEEWPSWNLPILRWAQKQGAVAGYSHSGSGLAVKDLHIPTDEMPKFDGIGANDFIVTGPLGACDFISTVDTTITSELNIWYHTLNCGVKTRVSGETDFPCIYGERVGVGRVYVKLPADKPLDYDRWADGIRDGRSYVSDGLTHLIDFQVGSLGVGEMGPTKQASVLPAKAGEMLPVTVKVAALLPEKPDHELHKRPLEQHPHWHVERARIGETRTVPVELIVNGQSVARQEVVADGTVKDIKFQFRPEKSSWVAIRIYPAAHTNPVFVIVDDKPIRASRQSAAWCLRAVDVCWKSKERVIRPADKAEAKAAYDEAAKYYKQVLAEAQQ
ncbi:MAG: CehA/McbA family metallohydrolase [Planctomycetia bacterium]|nr:CehA/McbA family metallohydrolase [Planctomycetia bacterium]